MIMRKPRPCETPVWDGIVCHPAGWIELVADYWVHAVDSYSVVLATWKPLRLREVSSQMKN